LALAAAPGSKSRRQSITAPRESEDTTKRLWKVESSLLNCAEEPSELPPTGFINTLPSPSVARCDAELARRAPIGTIAPLDAANKQHTTCSNVSARNSLDRAGVAPLINMLDVALAGSFKSEISSTRGKAPRRPTRIPACLGTKEVLPSPSLVPAKTGESSVEGSYVSWVNKLKKPG